MQPIVRELNFGEVDPEQERKSAIQKNMLQRTIDLFEEEGEEVPDILMSFFRQWKERGTLSVRQMDVVEQMYERKLNK